MTTTGQDFTIYAGDSSAPVITVTDLSGAPFDLSGVDDIQFDVQRTITDAAVITKLKSTGGIVFAADGSDGKFVVDITKADSAPLFGYYLYRALVVIEPGASPQTVTTGRLHVERFPTSTYSGDPTISPKDAVRYWLNDTDSANWQLSDQEIGYTLSLYPNPIRAAAQCATALSAKYARRVSKRVGDLSISYSDIAKQYQSLAASLEVSANTGVTPYAGGISVSDRATVEADCDRAKPPFREKQFDNPYTISGGSGPFTRGGEDDIGIA